MQSQQPDHYTGVLSGFQKQAKDHVLSGIIIPDSEIWGDEENEVDSDDDDLIILQNDNQQTHMKEHTVESSTLKDAKDAEESPRLCPPKSNKQNEKGILAYFNPTSKEKRKQMEISSTTVSPSTQDKGTKMLKKAHSTISSEVKKSAVVKVDVIDEARCAVKN